MPGRPPVFGATGAPLPALSSWDLTEDGVYWLDHEGTQYQIVPSTDDVGTWRASVMLSSGNGFLVTPAGAMVALADLESWDTSTLNYSDPSLARDALLVLAWRQAASTTDPPAAAHAVYRHPDSSPDSSSGALQAGLLVLALGAIGFVFWKNWV